jgi:hypothetical protein
MWSHEVVTVADQAQEVPVITERVALPGVAGTEADDGVSETEHMFAEFKGSWLTNA